MQKSLIVGSCGTHSTVALFCRLLGDLGFFLLLYVDFVIINRYSHTSPYEQKRRRKKNLCIFFCLAGWSGTSSRGTTSTCHNYVNNLLFFDKIHVLLFSLNKLYARTHLAHTGSNSNRCVYCRGERNERQINTFRLYIFGSLIINLLMRSFHFRSLDIMRNFDCERVRRVFYRLVKFVSTIKNTEFLIFDRFYYDLANVHLQELFQNI